jgi:hypothetical protein
LRKREDPLLFEYIQILTYSDSKSNPIENYIATYK